MGEMGNCGSWIPACAGIRSDFQTHFELFVQSTSTVDPCGYVRQNVGYLGKVVLQAHVLVGVVTDS
jgi:hypothetical protein